MSSTCSSSSSSSSSSLSSGSPSSGSPSRVVVVVVLALVVGVAVASRGGLGVLISNDWNMTTPSWSVWRVPCCMENAQSVMFGISRPHDSPHANSCGTPPKKCVIPQLPLSQGVVIHLVALLQDYMPVGFWEIALQLLLHLQVFLGTTPRRTIQSQLPLRKTRPLEIPNSAYKNILKW